MKEENKEHILQSVPGHTVFNSTSASTHHLCSWHSLAKEIKKENLAVAGNVLP
jgi:hypothetical protein